VLHHRVVTVKALSLQAGEQSASGGFLVDNMDDGISVIREVVTAGFRPSVCRVYSEEDADQHFADFDKGKCVLILHLRGSEGDR